MAGRRRKIKFFLVSAWPSKLDQTSSMIMGKEDSGREFIKGLRHLDRDLITAGMKGINVDPELEDEFLSSYVDNTLRWTWHACSSSVWWTIVRFVCMHLQIFNPSVYHLCCKKIYGINIGSEFAMWKYWSTIIELLSPLNGFIMLWKKERMQRYNLLFGLPFYASIFPSGCLIPKLKKCSAGSIPYQAVAYAIFEEQCVLFLMFSIICPLVGDGYYLTAHGQSQLCWIMAGVGTMLHMRYISHLVFTCMSVAVLLTSLIYTLVRQAWCSDMVSGSFIFCGISVASVCLARIREIRWRRHFVAQKRTQMLSEHLHSLLSTMLPADASEHLITTSSLHPTLDSNWGKIHDNVTILFVSINLNYKEGMMQEADSGALIEELNYIFSLLDAVLDQHTECYKVETVCNVYVVSAGVPSACEQHAQAAAALACHMAALLDQFLPPSGKAVSWQMGLHSGPLFAGIAGRICPRYRLFGDTMNTASRMCSVSARGGISASRAHIDCLINQHLQIPADLRSKVTVPIECWLRRDNAQGVEESVVECHNVRQHVDHVELHLSGRQHIKGKGVMEVWSLRPLIKALKQVPSAQEANHSNGAETDDVGLRASASMSATRGDNQRQTSGQESKSDNTRHLLPHAEIGEPRTKVEKDAEDNKQDSIHSQTAATSSYTAVTRVCGLNGAGSSVCGDSAAVRQAQAGQGTNDVGGRGRGEGQARGYWRDADGGARVGPHLRYRKSAGATSGECSFTNEASFGESASTFGESASTFPTHEAIFRDNSFDIDSIVLTCEEETALLLASGSNGQGGWPKEQSRNAILERMYFRRRCIASLPRTFAAVVCVGTLSGVLLLLEMDILMSHPRLRPAAMLALCCWGAVALAGLVLGCIYYSSTQRVYRSETVVYRSQLSCHLQVASSTLAALSLYFLINFHYLERLSHWGGDSGKEGSEKVISTSETDFAGMLSAINSHWLPRTRGFVYMTSIVNIHDMIALFFCMMQVCFDLPLWCAICLVALNIQQKISYFKFAGADYALEIKTECSLRNYTYRQYMLTEQNVGLLALCGAVCVYNIWLTERLERKQWCILMKETSKRLRIRGVLSTLMPDFVLQACSRLGTVKSSRANSRRTRDLGFSKTTRSLFSSVSFLIGTNLSTSNKSADDWFAACATEA